MNNILDGIFESADYLINNQNSILEEAVLYYYEEYDKLHYVSEGVVNKTLEAISVFFANVISTLNTLYSEVMKGLKSTMLEINLDVKLIKLKYDLKERAKEGIRTVTFIDIWKYKDKYLEMESNLWSTSKRLAKCNYKTLEQIDSDIRKFESLINSYETELKKIEDTKIKISTEKLIDFVNKELHGESKVIDTIKQSINSVNDMEIIAKNISLRKTISGVNVIPRHISIIKRMTNSISTFIRKKVAKFISLIVFVFA